MVEFSPATREARVRFPANAGCSLEYVREWFRSLKKKEVVVAHISQIKVATVSTIECFAVGNESRLLGHQSIATLVPAVRLVVNYTPFKLQPVAMFLQLFP